MLCIAVYFERLVYGHKGPRPPLQCSLRVGWARTVYINTYIRCTYGIFSREITIHTVVYGVYIQFWPTLQMCVILEGIFVLGSRERCTGLALFPSPPAPATTSAQGASNTTLLHSYRNCEIGEKASMLLLGCSSACIN